MSHNKLRTEKNCLNCNHVVEERFCTHCGQENVKIQDSAIHLIIHYMQDLVHYDGRFWHTFKNLFTRPGKVAVEYMEGKRKSNLEPIRLYVFASTVFFFLLFFIVKTDNWNAVEPKRNYEKRLYNLEQEKEFIKGSEDTTYANFLARSLQYTIDSLNALDNDTSRGGFTLDLNGPLITDTTSTGWLERIIFERAEERRKEMEVRHDGDERRAAKDYMDEVFHQFPLLLFLSMPFFALLLKILYFRTFRKNYVEHFIFSIYHYSYLFVTLSLFMVVQYAVELISPHSLVEFFNYLFTALMLYMFFYLMFSMKRFYKDRWVYLIPRYIVLAILFTVILILLFLLVLFLTFLF